MRLPRSLYKLSSSLFFVLILVFFFRPKREREFAIGEPVPLSALRSRPPHADPFNPPALVLLKAEDVRRRGRPPFKPFIPRSLTWTVSPPHARIAFPRTLLNDLSRLRVVLEGSSPRAMYCLTPGLEFLNEHLETRYEVVQMHSLALRDRERILLAPSVFRFVLATHPFTRLESAFREGTKHDLDSPEYRKFMNGVRGTELREDEREVEKISLRFFVAFLASRELKEPFISATQMCHLGRLNYHLIGDVSDLGLINGKLGVSGRTIILLPGDNIRRDSRLRAKVARMYGDDMRTFHYDVTRK